MGGAGPQATQSAIAQLIVVCKKIDLFCLAEPPQLFAPTVDSNQTNVLGRCPWYWDEAAPYGLGGAGPQAMQSARAAGHHGMLFTLKKVICTEEDVVWSKVGEGAPCQTYEQTSNRLHTIFYVPGLRYPFFCETHCRIGVGLHMKDRDPTLQL